MTAPIILRPLKAAGFDLVWFGVVMVVVLEMGLIHPPVGLNIFVINRIAPDILSFVPGIAMGLPNLV